MPFSTAFFFDWNFVMTNLETENLILRPFVEGDFEWFERLHGDVDLTAMMHRGALGRGQARELFDGYRDAFQRDGFGVRAVIWRETGEAIGECGLWMREDAGGYTLRYMLARDWWGRGLTGEAARATVAEAFGPLGMDLIHAIAMDRNVHSVKALLRLGMVKVEENHRGIPGFGRYALARKDTEEFARPG